MGSFKMAATTTANRNIPKKFKWSIDLSNRNRTTSELPVPPGYLPSVASAVAEATRESDTSLLIKRSWDVALQPLKSVPMNLFMMYMVGSSISIFPIMMVGMMFVRPIRALYKCQSMGLLPTHSSDWLAFIEPRQRIEYSA